jgi:hypothetical protein
VVEADIGIIVVVMVVVVVIVIVVIKLAQVSDYMDIKFYLPFMLILSPKVS